MIGAFAALLASIAFVPLDDRPVTAELPLMLGRIAGVHVDMPPPELIGHYLTQGRPDSIVVWLNQRSSDKATRAFVVSSDMLAYGGLLASRVPGVTYTDAYFRLKELVHLRAKRRFRLQSSTKPGRGSDSPGGPEYAARGASSWHLPTTIVTRLRLS